VVSCVSVHWRHSTDGTVNHFRALTMNRFVAVVLALVVAQASATCKDPKVDSRDGSDIRPANFF
jgi:hypothetical protein